MTEFQRIWEELYPEVERAYAEGDYQRGARNLETLEQCLRVNAGYRDPGERN